MTYLAAFELGYSSFNVKIKLFSSIRKLGNLGKEF